MLVYFYFYYVFNSNIYEKGRPGGGELNFTWVGWGNLNLECHDQVYTILSGGMHLVQPIEIYSSPITMIL